MQHDDDHGTPFPLARNGVGSVAICGCGVVTLNLQALSLRFEPPAFRELQQLLDCAQRRLDHAVADGSERPAAASPPRGPVH